LAAHVGSPESINRFDAILTTRANNTKLCALASATKEYKNVLSEFDIANDSSTSHWSMTLAIILGRFKSTTQAQIKRFFRAQIPIEK
jgi:hypothetical protein